MIAPKPTEFFELVMEEVTLADGSKDEGPNTYKLRNEGV